MNALRNAAGHAAYPLLPCRCRATRFGDAHERYPQQSETRPSGPLSQRGPRRTPPLENVMQINVTLERETKNTARFA